MKHRWFLNPLLFLLPCWVLGAFAVRTAVFNFWFFDFCFWRLCLPFAVSVFAEKTASQVPTLKVVLKHFWWLMSRRKSPRWWRPWGRSEEPSPILVLSSSHFRSPAEARSFSLFSLLHNLFVFVLIYLLFVSFSSRSLFNFVDMRFKL